MFDFDLLKTIRTALESGGLIGVMIVAVAFAAMIFAGEREYLIRKWRGLCDRHLHTLIKDLQARNHAAAKGICDAAHTEAVGAVEQARRKSSGGREVETSLFKSIGDAIDHHTSGRATVMRILSEAHVRDFVPLIDARRSWMLLLWVIAPMLGLFGTVAGLVDVFDHIQQAGGRPDPATLAQDLKLALGTTFLGLIAAIPIAFVDRYLANKADALLRDVERFYQALAEALA